MRSKTFGLYANRSVLSSAAEGFSDEAFDGQRRMFFRKSGCSKFLIAFEGHSFSEGYQRRMFFRKSGCLKLLISFEGAFFFRRISAPHVFRKYGCPQLLIAFEGHSFSEGYQCRMFYSKERLL